MPILVSKEVVPRESWPRSPVVVSRVQGWSKTSYKSSESETSTMSFSFSSFSSSSLWMDWDEVASLVECWRGKATLGTPSGICWLLKVPSGIGWVLRVPFRTRMPSGRRKSRTATLILWRRGSQAFMMHFGAWKLDEIGLYPRIKWAALN